MNNVMNSKTGYILLAVIVVVILMGVSGVFQSDRSSIGEAVENIGDGIEDAGRKIVPKRTVGDRVDEAIDDVGDSVEEVGEDMQNR